VIPFPKPLAGDEAARDRIRNGLAESLIVEASAGTGKTSELVRRLLRVLGTGTGKIANLAAVTFTDKAAGELKLRLRQKLDEARQSAVSDDELAHLENALRYLEEAAIGTIHSFCTQILRERPVEAVVDPAFEAIAQGEAGRIFDRAFQAWLQRRLNEPSPGLRRALTRLSWSNSASNSPLESLKKAGWSLVESRDFPAAWECPAFDRDAEIDLLLDRAKDFAARSKKPLRPLREFLSGVARAEMSSARDYDLLEGQLLKARLDLRKERGIGAQEPLLQSLEVFRDRADATLAATLREEMRELVDDYSDLKRRSGKLDFNDLLILVRDLLRSNEDVRRYLQERYTHIFVDEFQDTDPLQAEILFLLAADDPREGEWLRATPKAGKLFLVGDPKQSIYKFRRADLSLYNAVCEEMVGRGVGRVKLTRSFRSVQPIQDFVNAAFRSEMQGDAVAGQAAYSPLEEGADPIAGQPAIVALPAPWPYGKQRISNDSIEACLPETVVAFVHWLLHESGWKVRDAAAGGQLVPVRSQHVALLFRRFTSGGRDVTREYARAFEAREMRHLLVGSKGFHDREEVETVRAALNAIEWPDDELSVFAALKGSLFAIHDGTLLRHRREAGRLHPFVREKGLPEVHEALRILAELHRERNRTPIADTVNSLLEATRAHASFALRPAGHQVLANVYRIVTLARGFEQSGGISFRSFVEELDRRAEKVDAQEAPVLEEGAEGVRMMTVHNAKGLEFPVVILADMTCRLHQEPDRYIDARRQLCATRLLQCAPEDLRSHAAEETLREEAEGVRVAYVAATRARDLLVVSACGDEERKGWLAPLSKALYPPYPQRRKAAVAEGCPPFGEATVLLRPGDLSHEDEGSVKPGAHRPQEGSHEVVWWDPAALNIQVRRPQGLPYEDILLPGDTAGLRKYQAWQEDRKQVLAQGKRKSLEVFTAADAPEPPPGYRVISEALPKPAKRPGGKRFGNLVHAILRDADLAADRATLGALADSHGRLLGSPDGEVNAAVDAAAAALAHPMVVRARSAARVHREMPVTLEIEPGRIFEGTLDLAFLEGSLWTIVDFKTDTRPAQYERQLQWYSVALSRITGQAVQAVLLAV
jgi:ATP-dependent exoDNAse (exonuclease V) beta subunit